MNSDEREALIGRIKSIYRRYRFLQDIREEADLRMMSMLRHELGWRRDMDEGEVDEIKAQAKKLCALAGKVARHEEDLRIGKAKKVKDFAGTDDLVFQELRSFLIAANQPMAPFEAEEAALRNVLEKAAAMMPAADWVRDCKGFGMFNFAMVIGECGDLANYANPGKLWKRCCLALVDGRRQGDPGPGASKDDWIRHGYNPSRRSSFYLLGKLGVLTKQIRAPKDEDGKRVKGEEATAIGPYGQIYLDRKAYETGLNEVGAYAEQAASIVDRMTKAGKKPIKDNSEGRLTAAHIDSRAQRYMTKRLLKDLWQAWREAASEVEPEFPLPPAELPAPMIQIAAE